MDADANSFILRLPSLTLSESKSCTIPRFPQKGHSFLVLAQFDNPMVFLTFFDHVPRPVLLPILLQQTAALSTQMHSLSSETNHAPLAKQRKANGKIQRRRNFPNLPWGVGSKQAFRLEGASISHNTSCKTQSI